MGTLNSPDPEALCRSLQTYDMDRHGLLGILSWGRSTGTLFFEGPTSILKLGRIGSLREPRRKGA